MKPSDMTPEETVMAALAIGRLEYAITKLQGHGITREEEPIVRLRRQIDALYDASGLPRSDNGNYQNR